MDRPPTDWLRAFRVYLGAIAVGNLLWETLQLPLYTIWTTGTVGEQVFAVVHCTGGDLLIALASLVLGLLLFGTRDWPAAGFAQVALAVIIFGVAYTAFSEWLNVSVRQSWAYADWMPIIPVGPARIGLSPLSQWIVVPMVAFWLVRHRIRQSRNELGADANGEGRSSNRSQSRRSSA